MSSKIEQALLEAVPTFKPKAKEDRQEYLGRLIVAVQGLDDDGWEGLDTKAQKWHVAAAKADNAEKDIPDFPDLEDDEEEEETPKKAGKKAAADEEDEEAEIPKKKASKKDEQDEEAGDGAGSDEEEDDDVKTPAKKKAAAAPAKKKAVAEKEAPAKKKVAAKEEAAPKKKAVAEDKPAGKVTGIKVDIKKMVIKKPSMSAEEIYEALGGKKAELSKVTISAVRSETRHTLRVLNDMGKLDIKI